MLIKSRLRLARSGILAGLLCLAGSLALVAQASEPVISLPDGKSLDAPAVVAHLLEQSRSAAQSAVPEALPLVPAMPPPRWPGLVQAAGVYTRFGQDVNQAIQTMPGSPEDLERLMIRLAGYDGTRLSLAFRAHAVLLAMATPDFADGVRLWGQQYDRQIIMADLRSNSAYASWIPGYAQAVAQILDSVSKDGAKVHLAGGVYKDLAYSLQHKRWAGKVRGSKAVRLAMVREAPMTPQALPTSILQPLMAQYQAAQQPHLPAPASGRRPVMTASVSASANGILGPLVRSIGPGPASAAVAIEPAKPPSSALAVGASHAGEIQDIMAIAALRILDKNAHFPAALPARRGPDYFAECIDWARMHLNQCIAATHYVYEDSFCIAEHQLKDAGLCLSDFARPASLTALVSQKD